METRNGMSFEKYTAYNNMLGDGEMDFSKVCQKADKGKKRTETEYYFFFQFIHSFLIEMIYAPSPSSPPHLQHTHT